MEPLSRARATMNRITCLTLLLHVCSQQLSQASFGAAWVTLRVLALETHALESRGQCEDAEASKPKRAIMSCIRTPHAERGVSQCGVAGLRNRCLATVASRRFPSPSPFMIPPASCSVDANLTIFHNSCMCQCQHTGSCTRGCNSSMPRDRKDHCRGVDRKHRCATLPLSCKLAYL